MAWEKLQRRNQRTGVGDAEAEPTEGAVEKTKRAPAAQRKARQVNGQCKDGSSDEACPEQPFTKPHTKEELAASF